MRLVIKIGTSLLTTTKHRLDEDFLGGLIPQIVKIKKSGHEIILVTSGAVAAGRSELKIEREKKNIPFRQALAAVGQGVLMKTYRDFFVSQKIPVAQALLTNYDFANRENFLNTKRVFDVLLGNGAVPIVNENDVTTIAELKFGDNDILSAKTAAMVEADFLIILTDVDGLYREDPKTNPAAERIARVQIIDDSIRSLAKGPRSNSSLGGMVTKLEAAEYVTSAGISMLICGGRSPKILERAVEFLKNTDNTNPPGTFFSSSVSRIESNKKWLKPKISARAWIEIDSGAAKALQSDGKSLLASGIFKIQGDFERGDVVMVKSGGANIAYGQVNYDSSALDKIKKHRSDEIEEILGFSFEDCAIHRDRMVILD